MLLILLHKNEHDSGDESTSRCTTTACSVLSYRGYASSGDNIAISHDNLQIWLFLLALFLGPLFN